MRMRRPVVVRRGPGVVGAVARTAVVAGTATVVAKGVSGAMDSNAQAQQQQQAVNASAAQSQADVAQMQGQMQQMQAQLAQQQPATQPVQAAAPGPDLTTQLQQLAQLKESGVLSDDEFQAAKAKLLGR
jgi:hypothetical protein